MMSVIGAGIMLGGLLAGAMLGCSKAVITTILIGCILLIAAGWKEHMKQLQAESWRANYPTYKY